MRGALSAAGRAVLESLRHPLGLTRRPAMLILLPVAAGAAGLATTVPPAIPLAVLLLAALAARPAAARAIIQLAGAVIVATLSLLGVAIAVRWVVVDQLDWRLPIIGGLAIAFAVYWLAVYLFLQPQTHFNTRPAAVAGGLLAAAWVFGVPWVPSLLGNAKGKRVSAAIAVGSQIDVFLVLDRPQGEARPRLPLDAVLAGFDVHYSVGFAEGEGVRWELVDDPDESAARRVAAGEHAITPVRTGLLPREGADAVLLLVPDPTPVAFYHPSRLAVATAAKERERTLRRWQAVRAAALGADVRSYAVLRTTDARRIARWGEVAARVVSVQRIGGRTLTGAGGRFAIGSDRQKSDFELARRFQPVLLFDAGEPVPRPLSIETVFADGRARLCEGVQSKGECPVVTDPKALLNGGDRQLLLKPDGNLHAQAEAEADARAQAATRPPRTPGAPPYDVPPAVTGAVSGLGDGSAMYVHPVDDPRRNRVYLDYWWYLAFNPAGAGGGGFCGPGLAIPGVTCFDHESDWEGVTVVVDRATAQPVEVHYAQHEAVVRYCWKDLRAEWRRRSFDDPRVQAQLNGGQRPLVFSARGTHASYTVGCRSGCRHVAEDLREQDYDGTLPWIGSFHDDCGTDPCLKLLPTRAGGDSPALWSAFDGEWGRRRCFLRVYCDTASAPAAPGQQDRYEDPTRFDGTARADGTGYLQDG